MTLTMARPAPPTLTMARPAPPTYELAPGFEWVAEPETTEGYHAWSTDPAISSGKRCRWGSPWRGYCGRPAVATLNRSREPVAHPRWYGYCDLPRHLYGRWVEDGVVLSWRARRVTPTTVRGTEEQK